MHPTCRFLKSAWPTKAAKQCRSRRSSSRRSRRPKQHAWLKSSSNRAAALAKPMHPLKWTRKEGGRIGNFDGIQTSTDAQPVRLDLDEGPVGLEPRATFLPRVRPLGSVTTRKQGTHKVKTTVRGQLFDQEDLSSERHRRRTHGARSAPYLP